MSNPKSFMKARIAQQKPEEIRSKSRHAGPQRTDALMQNTQNLILTLNEVHQAQGKQSQKNITQMVTRNPEIRTNVQGLSSLLDVPISGPDDYNQGSKLNRFGNDARQNSELQKIIGDKLNKRYSSRKKAAIRNPNVGYG